VRLSNLASFESLRFPKFLRIEETFSELPPEQLGRVKLDKLKIVDDGAERGAAMISAFNDSL